MMLTSHYHSKLFAHLIYSAVLFLLIIFRTVSLQAQTGTDTVWVEDATPAGATRGGQGETWTWVSSNPTPYSGTSAHQSAIVTGFHQHYFLNATDTLTINIGDALFVYIYLDPANMPREVAVQGNDGAWGQNAYWGENLMSTSTTKVRIGDLPAGGGWVRLEVPASQIGLEGKTLKGMAFKLYDGRATWDRAGKSTPPPNSPPTVTLTSPADQSILTVPANITITANASDAGGSISKVEFFQGTTKLGEDTAAPYSWSWNGAAAGSYALTARATDNAAATTTSGAVNITVKTLLSGRITNAVTMAGIAGATVKVYQGSVLASTVTTDSAGDFTVAGLAAGTYNAEASAADYAPQNQNAVVVSETAPATANFSLKSTAWSDTVWVEDAIPAGAAPTGTWAWVGSSPAPFSGVSAHQSVVTGFNQHYFKGATSTLAVASGDRLFSYVYLDPSNPPTEVMLQWYDSAWGKAAYWGADQISTTPPRVYMGPLPSAGGWVRLEVLASYLGLEGKTLNGMAFKQYNGRATWDRAGKSTPPLWYQADDAAIAYKYDELGRLVAVINPSGDTATYHYDAVGNLLSISRQASSQVSIINITPTGGQGGMLVTLAGTGFSPIASQNTVTFNGVAATVTSASPTQLTMNVPAGATTGPITVTTPIGSATSNIPFTVNPGGGAPTITGISPTVGERGTAVTVTGTNFETNPVTNNRLKFNISGSEITAATSTSIVATAPPFTGAGRISVTTPNGQAVSSSDFFIPPATRSAADVQVTGRITYGETKAVSLTGGKLAMIAFDGTAGQRVMLDLPFVETDGQYVITTIINPNGTNLGEPKNAVHHPSAFLDTRTLPSTGTYTILLTPYGANTSTPYANVAMTLYSVPPDITGPITPDGSQTQVSIASAGQNARLTFDGTAGQRVSLTTSDLTSFDGNVYIYKPDGSLIIEGPNSSTIGFGGFLEPKTLPVIGTYTVLVDPTRAVTCALSLNLYHVVDVVNPTTLGESRNVTITTPGQAALLTFNGTSGQQVSVNMSGMAISQPTNLSLLNPSGTALPAYGTNSPQGILLDAVRLDVTGTYTIKVDPQGTGTGSATVTAYDAPDVTDQIAPGETKTVTTTSPGQNARLTFSGTAGQRISLNSSGVTIPTGAFIRVIRPNGQQFDDYIFAGSFLGPLNLLESGTHTIFIDPREAGTGSVSVTLYNIVDIAEQINFGESKGITITTPGQDARLAFSGTAGQQVSITLTGGTISSSTELSLWAISNSPDDSLRLHTVTANPNGDATLNWTLGTTGTFKIYVNPAGAGTGNATISLINQ